MLNELIPNKVYYKIFDKSNKHPSYIYGKYKTTDVLKAAEIEQKLNAVLSKFQASHILILHQVHGNNIIDADVIADFKLEPQADGAITTKNNVILTVQSADCVPVLISSCDGKVIGAAHCGWKSVKLCIIETLIHKMKDKGAKEMIAVVGPAIQQNSYEVDQLFYNNFTSNYDSSKSFFCKSDKNDHYMFDLPGFVEYVLKQEGISIVYRIMEDTYTNADKYPSYRRSCHLGTTNKTENILSTIMIKG